MSGLVAILNLDGSPVDAGLLERMTSALESRGRDRRSVWLNGRIGLGHTLHKSTDEAEYEKHPATLDGRSWLISSARIDDRRELIRKLGSSQLIIPEQTPDTELILLAYQTWGEQCTEHLLGDFAFIIWDSLQNRLFCARDRFGMRQLYHTRVNDSFVISNSLYCLLHYPGISTTLNEQTVGDFLLFGDPVWMDREKTRTIFKAITKVPPAHTLTIADHNPVLRRYWSVPRELPLLVYRDERDYIAHFHESFTNAVRDRMRYPAIAVSMSGGLDSTSIAAYALRGSNHSGRNTNLVAVTNTYRDFYPDKEGDYAQLAAEKLGIPIQYVSATQYPLLEQAVLTTRPMEFYQPGLWLETQRSLAGHSRVCLAGYAGDNLLSSTPLFGTNKREWPQYHVLRNFVRLYKKYRQIPALGTGIMAALRWLRRSPEYYSNRSAGYPSWLNPQFEAELKLRQRWRDFHALLYISGHPRHPRIDYALTQPDWNTDDLHMTCGFVFPDERDPYLDARLVEFILSLPPLPWLFNKHLLRTAMQGRLPEAILARPKTTMGETLVHLLARENSAWVDRWQPVTEMKRYIQRDKIQDLYRTDRYQFAVMTIRPLILNLWLEGLHNLVDSIRIHRQAVD